MKYYIFNKTNEKTLKVKEEVVKILNNNSHIEDINNPDIIITIGGDGTYLKAVNFFKNRLDDVIFLSINSGNLGFYSNFISDDIDNLENIINHNGYVLDSHPLLDFYIKTTDNEYKGIALNEITLTSLPYVQILDIIVDDSYFEEYHGAGVCICTPSGSTAYNKSLNGAVMDPMLQGLQITEIAPINSNKFKTLASPIIFHKNRIIKIIPKTEHYILFSYDNSSYTLDNVEYILCNLSKSKAKYLRKEEDEFLMRIKKAFL